MPLDDAQKQKAKEYFDQHFKCANCGQKKGYEVSVGYVWLEQPKPGSMLKAPNMLPVLMVGCDECAFVQFYSAKTGGIAP